MRKIFEEKICSLYERMHLSISIITLKTEINLFLREKNKQLANVPELKYIWATETFELWIKENNLSIDGIIDDFVQYLKTTIIILRLPIKEHNALIKANIKYLDDLKESIKNPQKLMAITGISFDLINKIILNYNALVESKF